MSRIPAFVHRGGPGSDYVDTHNPLFGIFSGRPRLQPMGRQAVCQGLDTNPGARVQPSNQHISVGVGPANQRVLARRRSLPTKGCPCEEAETTNLLSRGWRCRNAW